MILGIGSDLCDIQRIADILLRHGDRFLARTYSLAEREEGRGRSVGQSAAFFAKRFAAKEACAKALGTGFRDGLTLRDISTMNDPLGRPVLSLSGGAQRRLLAICPAGMVPYLHVSLSDESGLAQAFVVIEAASP